jgi:iron complex outermembrane receptor protein
MCLEWAKIRLWGWTVVLVTIGSQAQAQEPDTPDSLVPTQLEEITVTASRGEESLSDLSTSVSQVSREELQTQLGLTSNILQTLDPLVPGLAVSSDFRNSTFTTIRGRTAQLLINGVPTNDNLRTSNTRGLASLSPFAVDQIEVVRGGTPVFGAGAPGGIINVITQRATSERLQLELLAQGGVNPDEFGDTRELNFSLRGGQMLSGGDYFGGVSYQDFGTRRNPDGGLVPGQEDRSWTFDGSAGLRLGRGELRFTGSYFYQDPGIVYELDGTQVAGERFADQVVVAPRNPFEDQAEAQVMVGALSFEHPSVLGHRLDASLYAHDESNIQRAAFLFDGEVFYTDSDQDNQRYGFRSALTRGYDLGASRLETTYGVDLLRQRFYRPLIDLANGGAISGYVSPEVLLNSVAVFAQPQFRTGNWVFTGGVRYERFYGEVGSQGYDPALEDAATPGDIPTFDLTLFNLGIVRYLTRSLQAYAGFSQGAEIAEFGRAARGVDDPSLIRLSGAPSDQYELGLRGRAGPVGFTAAAFYSKSDESAQLDSDPSCADQPFCPLVPVRVSQEVRGLEATADWPVRDRLTLGTVLTVQDGEFGFPNEDPIPLGSDVVSPLRVTGYVDVEPLTGWRSRLQATYTAASDVYDAAHEAEGFRDSEELFLADVTSSYPVGPGRLGLGIANLFDRRYVNVANSVRGDFFYYLSEGRRARLSYAVTW